MRSYASTQHMPSLTQLSEHEFERFEHLVKLSSISARLSFLAETIDIVQPLIDGVTMGMVAGIMTNPSIVYRAGLMTGFVNRFFSDVFSNISSRRFDLAYSVIQSDLGFILHTLRQLMYTAVYTAPEAAARFLYGSSASVAGALVLTAGREQISAWTRFREDIRNGGMTLQEMVQRYEAVRQNLEGHCRATQYILLQLLLPPVCLLVAQAIQLRGSSWHSLDIFDVIKLVINLVSLFVNLWVVARAFLNAVELNAASLNLAKAILAMVTRERAAPLTHAQLQDLLSLHQVVTGNPPAAYFVEVPLINYRVSLSKTSLSAVVFALAGLADANLCGIAFSDNKRCSVTFVSWLRRLDGTAAILKRIESAISTVSFDFL